MAADEMMMTIDDFLPDNIITDIISRLPADSIIQCKRVCRTWRTLTDELLHNSTFLHTHARRFIASSASAAAAVSSSSSYGFLLRVKFSYDGDGNSRSSTNTQFHIGEYYYHDNVDESSSSTIFNYNPLKFRRIKQITSTDPTNYNNNNPFPMDSDHEHNLLMDWSVVSLCNGLICLVSNPCNDLQNYEVCICNPVTREYVNLMPYFNPRSERRMRRKMESVVATGFGYHPCTNEYKVVRISQKPWKIVEGKVTVSVYTLGSTGGKWRTKGEFSHQFKRYKKTSPAAGLLFDGALHWRKLSAGGGEIVSFDLADEEFRIIPPPPHPDNIEHDNDQLVVLGGCLCVIRRQNHRDDDDDESNEIWVMNNEDYSWTMKFNIPPVNPIARNSTATRPIALLKDKILLSYGAHCMKFTCYDPKTSTTITIDNRSSTTTTTIDNDHNVINLGADQGPVCETEMIPYTASFVSLKALGQEKVNVTGKRKRSATEAAIRLLHLNQEVSGPNPFDFS